jgi:hypothetical protein
VKYWEIIADNLSKAGWSWGCVSAIDANGRTIWIADAHRDDEKRFIVHADEKLSAFMELESATRASGELPRQTGEIFSKLARYENKHSTSSSHICTRLRCAFADIASGCAGAGRRLSRVQYGRGARCPFQPH